MRRLLLGSVVSLAALLALPASAQQQDNLSLGALITNTQQGAGTVTSAPQINSVNNGVSCTYAQPVSSGSPSTVFSIQFQDTASGLWTSLVTSGAITTTGPTTPVTIEVYPGIQTSSLPTNVSASVNLKLPRNWRVSETVTAAANVWVTGTIGCDLLK